MVSRYLLQLKIEDGVFGYVLVDLTKFESLEIFVLEFNTDQKRPHKMGNLGFKGYAVNIRYE